MKNKIKSRKEIVKIVKQLKNKGKKIVFTNGCFDILHIGHIRLLQRAKKLGDILILGLNSDNSIKTLKGPKRPIFNEKEREEILSALEYIDYITIFNEKDPCNIISLLKPDIHVKGKNYDPKDYSCMPEAKIVHEYGGKVKTVNIIKNKSTTKIIEKIRNGNGNN